MPDEKKSGASIGFSDERARAAYDMTIDHWRDVMGEAWRNWNDRTTSAEEIARQQREVRALAPMRPTRTSESGLPRDAQGRFIARKQQPIGGPSRSYRAGPNDLAAARAQDLAARYPTLAMHLADARPTAQITARGAPGYDKPWDHMATWWRHAREKYPTARSVIDFVPGGLFDPDVTYGPADWAMALEGPMEGITVGVGTALEHGVERGIQEFERAAPGIARRHAGRTAAIHAGQHGSKIMEKVADWMSRGLYAKDEAAAEHETGQEQPVQRYEDVPLQEMDASEPGPMGAAPVITPSREDELSSARRQAYDKAHAMDQFIGQLHNSFGGPSVRDLYRRR